MTVPRAGATPGERAETYRAYADEAQRRERRDKRRARFGIVRLSTVESEAVGWLWDSFIPDAMFTLLEGDPDAGKTLLALQVAACLSMGSLLPRAVSDGHEPQRVLYLTAEDSLSKTIRPRLEAAGAELGQILVQEPRGADLLLPDAAKELEAIIRDEGVKLVVLDPLNSYLNASKVNVNREQDVRRALRPLRDLAEAENVSIVGLRHLNKSSDKPAMYRGSGSVGLTAVARSVLLLARHPDDRELRVLIQEKCNLIQDSKRKPLGFRIGQERGQPRIEWVDHDIDIGADELLEPRKPGPRPDTLEKAKGFLRDHLQDGPKRRHDLLDSGEKVGLNEKILERAARALGVRSLANGRERQWSL